MRRPLARLRRVLAIALCVAACLFVLGSCNADRLVLGTDPGAPASAAGASRHLIESDGETIECWLERSPAARNGRQPEAYVLFIPGKGSRADAWTSVVANAWGDRSVEVWGMNYPGFGGTTGPPTLARVGPTALAAYDALKLHANGRPVFLQSASFGTAAALHVADQREPAGLILHKPPPLRQLILGRYGWWNLWLMAVPVVERIPADLDSLANASRAKLRPAVFLIHGADGISPATYQRKVADAYAGPKRIIEMPNAAHGDPLTREAAEQMRDATDWLWQQAMRSTPSTRPM